MFSLSALAQSWTVSKGPRFGILISRREFAELDRLFYRATAQAVGICILGGLALLVGLIVVRWHFAIGKRFLDPGPTSLLVLATVVNQIIFGQAIYLLIDGMNAGGRATKPLRPPANEPFTDNK